MAKSTRENDYGAEYCVIASKMLMGGTVDLSLDAPFSSWFSCFYPADPSAGAGCGAGRNRTTASPQGPFPPEDWDWVPLFTIEQELRARRPLSN